MISKRRCQSKVFLSTGQTRNCKSFAQIDSIFCYQHFNQSNRLPVATSVIAEVAKTASNPSSVDKGMQPTILGIPAEVIDELVNKTNKRIGINRFYIEKDIYVTDSIRLAVVQSLDFPDAMTVFLGGTALAKGSWLNRFSEDVDIRLVPPYGVEFGHDRKRRLRKEIMNHLLSNTNLDLKDKDIESSRARVLLEYPTIYDIDNTSPMSVRGIGEVKVEYAITSQLQGYQEMRKVNSYIGETAALLDPSLLDEFPALQPFYVLAAKPVSTIVDKLHAMNSLACAGNLDKLAYRVRDIFDVSTLLSHEDIRSTVNSSVVAELDEHIYYNTAPGFDMINYPRPDAGFGASSVFQPGDPACEALRKAYPSVRSFVFSDDDWIEFDDALEIIKNHSHLL